MAAVTSWRRRLAGITLDVATAIRPVRVRGIARALWWLTPLTLGRGTQCVTSATGVKLCVDLGQYFDCMMVYGRFAPELLALLREVLRPGDSVMDIGAQLGFVSSNMAAMVGPSGRVHAIEPDPKALEMLRQTIEANGHDWIEVFPLAASDREGEIEFHLSPVLGWSTAVGGTHHRDLETISVPSRRIDDLLDQDRLRRPLRLIKLDVEGYEHAVLDGMQKLLAEDRPILVMENAPIMLKPLGLTSADVLPRITRHDYRVFRLGEAEGLLRGEQYVLTEIDPAVAQEFCDLVCVPTEERIPLRSTRRSGA